MGYITRFFNEITITPPIPWGQIKDSEFLQDRAREEHLDVMFRVVEREEHTDKGLLIVREAVALIPTWEEEMRGYEIAAHVQRAVDAFPGHEFGDRFDCEGEETGDLWRLKVVDRRATKFEPAIVWPQESE